MNQHDESSLCIRVRSWQFSMIHAMAGTQRTKHIWKKKKAELHAKERPASVRQFASAFRPKPA